MKAKFELTPEEVEMVYNVLYGLKKITLLIDPTWSIDDDDSQTTQIAENLLNRIKQCKDENKTNS